MLYEDDSLLALDKPGRLLTSPDRDDAERPNLMKLLHRDIEHGAAWTVKRRITYLANAHRLDFETSGTLLLAKAKSALIQLADQFGAETPEKNHVALVHGNPVRDQFQIDAELAPHPVKPGIVLVDARRGKKSRTDFTVLERFQGYALLKCQPGIGRAHQIRVHLKQAGFPVVGDSLYGGWPLNLSSLKPGYRLKPNRTERPLLDRAALHAEELTVTHPLTLAAVRIVAPWPKDLKVAVKYLRLFARSGNSSPLP